MTQTRYRCTLFGMMIGWIAFVFLLNFLFPNLPGWVSLGGTVLFGISLMLVATRLGQQVPTVLADERSRQVAAEAALVTTNIMFTACFGLGCAGVFLTESGTSLWLASGTLMVVGIIQGLLFSIVQFVKQRG